MTKQVETMASAGGMPWAGQGVKVSNNMTPEAMLKAAKCDWTVGLRKMAWQDAKGEWKEDKSNLRLVRESDDYPLTTCGVKWNPVQNIDAANFFKKFVGAGHMSMEHLGSLDHGRYLWALANINKTFSIGKEDEVKSFLLMIQPHVKGKAMVFKYMSMRSWCWNTLSYLLGSGVGRRGVIAGGFRMPHSVKFDETTKRSAEIALGLANRQADEFKEAVTLLSKKKASVAAVEKFFAEAIHFDATTADKKKDGEAREPRMMGQLREALENSPGHQLSSAAGTWWGAVNAVTYVVDHELGHDRSTALRTAWLGPKARLKQRAFALALEHAR